MKRVSATEDVGNAKLIFSGTMPPSNKIRDSIFQLNEQGEWRAASFFLATHNTLSLSFCPHCVHVHTTSVNVSGALFSGLRGNKKFIDKNEESLGRMLCVFLSAH